VLLLQEVVQDCNKLQSHHHQQNLEQPQLESKAWVEHAVARGPAAARPSAECLIAAGGAVLQHHQLAPAPVPMMRVEVQFLCHHCNQPIGDDMPVYMCRDASYCTATCRRHGRAAARKLSSSSCEPACEGEPVGAIGRLASDCTLSAWSSIPTTSDTTGVSSSTYSGNAHGTVATAAAVLTSVLIAGLRKFASYTKGIELLRPPSERALLWAAAAAAHHGPSASGTKGSADFSHLINKASSADFSQLIQSMSMGIT